MTTPNPQQLLDSVFGFGTFREGQEPVISRLLAGKSVLAIFPTGAGKSLCYQLPALALPGTTLVISPLIALMKDQIDFLKSKGIAADRLDSTLEFDESRRVLSDLSAGRLKLLYIAPERLASERFLQTLKRLDIAMLAVDEAHCISEWGHNFRPDYMKLATLARDLKVQRVLALTATATPSVATDIARAFSIDEGDIVKTPFHRKNLTLRVTPVIESDPSSTRNLEFGTRNSILLDRLKSRDPGPTIIYVTLQKTAEEVAAFLRSHDLPALAYHAGLNPDTRHDVQDAFMTSDRAIVVATIAFGMGIDKKDIRYVYHYNLPKTLENYAQEIGRAGRDGQPSTCELLAHPADRIPLENFTYGDTPSLRSIHALLADIFHGQQTTDHGQKTNDKGPRTNDTFDLSIYDLSGAHDIRPLVIETLLTYLELDGLIASTGPFYNEYKFQPLRPSTEMLARFDADRQSFIRSLLKCAKKAKVWFSLNLTDAMRATGADRARIVAALNFLEEQGDLKLEVAGARQGYRLLQPPPDLKELAENLTARFAHREKRDLERLQTVLDFASYEGCRTAHLLEYFGESLIPTPGQSAGSDSAPSAAPDPSPRCGHCDYCLNESTPPLTSSPHPPLTDAHLATIRQLKSQPHPALSTPRQLARFLCGITSPAATRARLNKTPAFASLANIPFATVLATIKEAR